MTLLTNAEYLDLGRNIVPLLGSALGGPSAQALRELARAYDPSADESLISAEVFLFHKYLLMQACVGVFPEAHVDHVVGGLFAALNEQASGLELGPDRQQTIGRFCQNVRAMESPPDLWAGNDGPSYLASHSVTIALDQMLSALGEIYRLHFQEES